MEPKTKTIQGMESVLIHQASHLNQQKRSPKERRSLVRVGGDENDEYQLCHWDKPQQWRSVVHSTKLSLVSFSRNVTNENCEDVSECSELNVRSRMIWAVQGVYSSCCYWYPTQLLFISQYIIPSYEYWVMRILPPTRRSAFCQTGVALPSKPSPTQQVDHDQWLNKICLKTESTLQYNLHCRTFLWVTMSWSKAAIITSLLIFLSHLILFFSLTSYREHIPPSNKLLTYQGPISSSTSTKPHLKTTVLNRLWKNITHYCFTVYI